MLIPGGGINNGHGEDTHKEVITYLRRSPTVNPGKWEGRSMIDMEWINIKR